MKQTQPSREGVVGYSCARAPGLLLRGPFTIHSGAAAASVRD